VHKTINRTLKTVVQLYSCQRMNTTPLKL